MENNLTREEFLDLIRREELLVEALRDNASNPEPQEEEMLVAEIILEDFESRLTPEESRGFARGEIGDGLTPELRWRAVELLREDA